MALAKTRAFNQISTSIKHPEVWGPTSLPLPSGTSYTSLLSIRPTQNIRQPQCLSQESLDLRTSVTVFLMPEGTEEQALLLLMLVAWPVAKPCCCQLLLSLHHICIIRQYTAADKSVFYAAYQHRRFSSFCFLCNTTTYTRM